MRSESDMIKEVKTFTDVNERLKIINVSEGLIQRINYFQFECLIKLKEYKWSLQYTIE